MSQPRFEVRLHKEAAREYERLDNSVVAIVDRALAKLEQRADEIGKPLGNKYGSKLAGCKEFKLRDAGIRIIFFIADNTVQVLRIVYVLSIGKREDGIVFKTAAKRLTAVKQQLDAVEDNKQR